jgi:amidase
MHVPLALGTQTGGSIIRPASYTGILGMKPTWGAISTEGQKVFSPIFDTTGFFARSVDDLQLLADAFRLRADGQPCPTAIRLRGSKFAVIRTAQWTHAQPGTVNAMEMAARLLRLSGAVVEEVDLPPEFDSLHLWHKQVMTTDGGITFYAEYCEGRAPLPGVLAGYVENKQRLSRRDMQEAMDKIARLRPLVDEILAEYAAAVTPSSLGEAPAGYNTGLPNFNTFWTVRASPCVFSECCA